MQSFCESFNYIQQMQIIVLAQATYNKLLFRHCAFIPYYGLSRVFGWRGLFGPSLTSTLRNFIRDRVPSYMSLLCTAPISAKTNSFPERKLDCHKKLEFLFGIYITSNRGKTHQQVNCIDKQNLIYILLYTFVLITMSPMTLNRHHISFSSKLLGCVPVFPSKHARCLRPILQTSCQVKHSSSNPCFRLDMLDASGLCCKRRIANLASSL